MEWQPIETAPYNVPILVVVEHRYWNEFTRQMTGFYHPQPALVIKWRDTSNGSDEWDLASGHIANDGGTYGLDWFSSDVPVLWCAPPAIPKHPSKE